MSNQLIYNPMASVIIRTDDVNNTIIDVSEDIISFTLNRMVNAVSTLELTLNNKNNKYTVSAINSTPVIKTMNTIAMILQGPSGTPIQVFTGYVVSAPVFVALPNAINISASCTLKKLQNTYWDSSIPELRQILPGLWSGIKNQNNMTDGGAGQGIYNLLDAVVGWQANKIYIEEIPPDFIQSASSAYAKTYNTLDETLIQNLTAAIDGNGIVGSAVANGGTMQAGSKVNSNYEWAATVLAEANLPVTQKNVGFMASWMAQEQNKDTWWGRGPKWKFNPLNTKYNTNANFSYPDLNAAAIGTAATLLQSNMHTIKDALNNPSTTKSQFATALIDSEWDPQKNGLSYVDDNNNIQTWVATFVKNDTVPVIAYPQTTTAYNNIAAKVIEFAETQIGVPYNNSSSSARMNPKPFTTKNGIPMAIVGPNLNNYGFDCSGLVYWAYLQTGTDIKYSTSSTMWDNSDSPIGPRFLPGQAIPLPGDILFWVGSDGSLSQPGHVSLCVQSPGPGGNGGRQIQASMPHTTVAIIDFSVNDQTQFVGFKRPWVSGIGITSSGTSAQNSSNSAGASTVNTSSTNPNTTSLFNLAMVAPQFNPVAIATFGSPRGFIMDEPVLNSIQQLAAGSFRNFMSLGTGEFIAWFPDYFGIWGNQAVYQIYNIEIIDFYIQHNDDPLTTHVAVSGDSTSSGMGQTVTAADWLQTVGIVSVQTPEIINMMFGNHSGILDTFDAQKFLAKYGMRPYTTYQPLIRDHYVEFSYAVMTFMNMWAQQFSTDINLTFMPEIFPGMRIQFPELTIENNMIEAYVQQVTHVGSMTNGFVTRVTITAPSSGGNLIYAGLS